MRQMIKGGIREERRGAEERLFRGVDNSETLLSGLFDIENHNAFNLDKHVFIVCISMAASNPQ